MNKEIKLSLAQQDVYYEQIMNLESALYNTGGYIIFNGDFNHTEFRKIVEGCFRDFDIFNLKFDFSGDEPVQYLNDPKETVLINDLDLSSQSDPYFKAIEWMQGQFNVAFDIQQNRWYRFTLIKLSNHQYILFGCFHHLISDGFGFAILANYFIDQYKKSLDEDFSLTVFYPSYLDAVRRSNEYQASEQYNKDAIYWKEKYQVIPDLILSQKKQNEDRGLSFSVPISEFDNHLLNRVSEQYNASISQLTIAALLIYFGKTTEQKEFSFGLPLHKRRGREERKTIGMFSGVLPFKGAFNPDISLSEVLTNIKQIQREDFRHALYPVSHLNRSLNLLSENRLQLFDIIINYIILPFPDSLGSDLNVRIKELRNTRDLGNPLTIRWVDYGENLPLELNFDYQESYFNEREIELLANRLLYIFKQFETSLDQPVGNISVIPEAEKVNLLEVFNDTTVGFSKGKTVVDLFEEQAANNPESIAAVDGEKKITYKELDDRSNQLAHYLARQGVNADHLVGICLDRGLEMVVGILGILKAGGAYLPIDPEYPEKRIAYMLTDSSVELVLCTDSSRSVLDVHQGFSAFHLDSSWESVAQHPKQRFDRVTSIKDLVYVMYTSGSTGNPKGVMLPQKAMFNLISFYHQLEISCQNVGQFTSMSFDVSFLEIFFTITQGGTLHIIPSALKSDLNGLVSLIKDRGIETLFLPTSFFHLIGSEKMLEQLTPVDHIVVAGEQLRLSQPVKEGLHKIGATLHNHYGPTEAHVVTTKQVDYNVENIREELVSIGKPIANTQIHILNDNLDLVPEGIVGELCIGGANVARGYWNKEQLTKEKFVLDPFRNEGRLYRTGDLARWMSDGNIEFIGRKDDQVKVRGYRIELGEIENALSQLEGVNQCCVLAKADSNGNNRLVGYVVMEGRLEGRQDGTQTDELDKTWKESLHESLGEVLPDYMIPQLWVAVEEMRLTSNGKLDKNALPDLDISALSSVNYVAPRSEIEEQLANIWQELLGAEKVGVYDNFFELGGHSLSATRLVATIRKVMEIEITIRDVFNYATIEALGNHLAAQSKGRTLPKVTVINPRSEQIPLTFSQERLWFLDQLQGTVEYHMPFAFRLSGNLDKEALFLSLKEVLSRHEILRTVIYSNDGVGYQQVLPVDDWKMSFRDFTADKSLLNDDLERFLSTPFDLSTDYMFRAQIYKLDEDEYVFAGTLHHISSDGWSQAILIGEFVELYNARVSGGKANLPQLSLQYADYAVWQRNYLEGEFIDQQISYWEEKLANVSPLQIPTDYKRPVVQSFAGETVTFELNTGLSEAISYISQKEGVTVFMTLLAAFKLLMSRNSGQDDICIGTPIARRTQKDLEGLIGFFVNTLALRTQVNKSDSFQDLLQAVKQTTLNAYDHQQTPFEKVVERVVKTRDMSISPLFQVMFALQNATDPTEIELDGLVLSEYGNQESNTAKFDLTITINETDSCFAVEFNYCTDLFKEATIHRMFVHYQELLSAIVANPSSQISDLSMIGEAEKFQILELYNETTASYPSNQTIVDLFERQVENTPDTTAVIYEGESLSYKQLNERSNQLAHYLLSKNPEPNALIGICIDRSIDMVVAILGVLKSGGVFIPIDPEYPQSRIDYVIEDSGVQVLLSSSGFSDRLSISKELDVVLLDSDWDQKIGIQPSKNLKRVSSPEHLAYVIYTSGSTGKPKGVPISHSSLLNFQLAMIDRLAMKDLEVFLSVTTYTFDIFYLELFAPLLVGARVIVLDSMSIKDGDKLQNAIERYRPDFMQATPSTWQMLVDNGWENKEKVTVLTGGEAIKESLKDSLTSSSDVVWNLYGPTEATIWVTAQQLKKSESVSIGSAINNVQLYILDNTNAVVPIGVAGELCIGGVQIAEGYLNRESLSKEKFINHPFKEGERLYKTGDLARWLADGNIDLIGRTDSQVKIRGYRIELGEIENALSLLEGIRQSCVIAGEDQNGLKRLIGYVVWEGHPEENLNKEYIQEKLQQRLPDYMVPRLWVELEQMPLTANGKLDRKALPVLDDSLLSASAYVAPGTELETQLVGIWQGLLGIAQIGIYDNFFELGGHSLLATRLVSMIRKELELEITVRDLFTHSNIDRLANHLSTRRKGAILPAVIYIDEKPDKIPLSFSQERLWFMDQLQGSLEYHLPFAFRLSGNLDKQALTSSLQQVVNRHEVLRTVIYSAEGVGYQKLLSANNWELAYQDLTKEGFISSEELSAFLSAPFDLSSDFMFRACLYQLGKGEFVLAGVFHHISSDGWSRGILTKEFTQIYEAHVSGNPLELPPLTLQYQDYALWQRAHLEGAIVDKELAYWEDALQGVSALQLPTDYTRPSVQSVSGNTISFELNNIVSAGINELSQKEGVTVFMTLLTAFKVLMSRYSGQEDICIGTPIANRTQNELEEMIGFFVNTLALRTQVTGSNSFLDLLQAVKQTTLQAYDHQQVPFERVVERVVKTRDQSMSPLFQVLFALQNTPDSGQVELDGLTISAYEQQFGNAAKFDMAVTVEESGTESEIRYSLDVNYCTDLFKEETIRRMIAHYQALLEAILDSPSSQIGLISFLNKEEKYQLLDMFNDTAVEYPIKGTIVDLFEDQVQKTPDATALIFAEESISYKELDARANQVAHQLTEKGVTAEELIGVCLDRGSDLIISILGVLKAGGAYVPIDPAYPQDRVQYIVKDAGLRVLVSKAEILDQISDSKIKDVILLDADSDSIAAKPTTSLNVNLSVDDLAYVIYTSGSTGKPKGVLIEHSGICNTIQGQISLFGLSGQDNCLQFASPSFDASVWESFLSLLSGATLCIIDEEAKYDTDYFAKYIDEKAISFATLPPAFFRLLDVTKLSGIQTLVTAGEEAPLENARLFSKTGNYFNAYGPTETSICATIYNGDFNSSVPIGLPVANATAFILNSDLALVPIGAVGELCVGGAGLARGYLHREALTAERFIDHPFKSGERLYRTGDLARRLPDGNIEFIGRADDQVKIRGYRIELGEVEHALSLLEDVRQSCVIARTDENGSKRLIAYVVMEDRLNKDVLQTELQKHLPEYMVPSLWVQLDEMPLTTNGKLDRKALPELNMSSLSVNQYVAPTTKTELQLAAIWQHLLGIEKVGLYDDFFELGGHSLLAVQLISKVQEIGYNLSIRDIFSNPTIALLSTRLSAVEEAYKVPENGILAGCSYITPGMVPLIGLNQEELDRVMDLVPGGGPNIQDIYPLAPLQEGIYFHYQMSDRTKGDPYVISHLLSFTSMEERLNFTAALEFVIGRHDVLRTCVLSDGFTQPMQVVLREVDLPLEELSLDSEKDILAQIQKETASDNLWMDLSRAPLLQVKLADDIANGAFYLILNFHHLIIDHLGLEKVEKEVRSYLSGQSSALPKPALYRDFVGHALNADKIAQSKEYFSGIFGEIESPTYPFNLSDTKIDGSAQMVTSRANLSAELRDELREVSGSLKVSPAVLFHAAFGLVVGRCSNSDYALFGSVLLGRLQGSKGSESSLGLFMNTLPVLLNLKGEISEYISHTSEYLQELLNYEQTPLSAIHQLSGFSNEVPLFSALLNYRHTTPGTLSDGTSDLGFELTSGEERTNYPFILSIDDFGNDFGLEVKLSDQSIDPSAVISYMESSLKLILKNLNGELKTTVDELSIVSDEERHQLLDVFNDTSVSFPDGKTVVDLFREQALNMPDAIAVSDLENKLTYKELDERSNQLAHYLRDQGVKADHLVGICLERGLEMVVGILGILKSGGAYLPIDPEYPEKRIAYMLTDSTVKLVLCLDSSRQALAAHEGFSVLPLDSEWSTIERFSSDQFEQEITTSDLAYVMYTSGSTGRPKGVMLPHRSMFNLISFYHQLDISSHRVGQFTSMSFDVSFLEIFFTVTQGGSLHIIPSSLKSDFTGLASFVNDHEIETVFLPTSFFHFIGAESVLEKLHSLEHIVVAGEQLRLSQVAKKGLDKIGATLHNHYGPTEAHVVTTKKVDYNVKNIAEELVSIGKPIANTQIYVLNDANGLVPKGIAGELCIAGNNVARGYWKNEQLTNEKFIPNPFKPEGLLYKTGDLARWLPDGNIEFIGRKDDQVKIRGYRIELGEVENALSILPGVNQCCVLAKADSSGNYRLVAYVKLQESNPTEAWKETMQGLLRESLPEHMVPQLWVSLDEIHLTSNGKLDKKALPDLDNSTLSTKEYLAPRTEMEEQLVRIWQDLLGVEKVGVYDNFFELGGHSLLATRLVATIVKDLEVDIMIKDIFSFVNIDELAAYLEYKKVKEQENSETVYKKTIKL